MSLEMPEGLRWLAWVAGTSWPDGDEDAAWAASAAWQAAADELKALLPMIDQAEEATKGAYSDGEAAAAIGARFEGLRTGDQSLEALADMLQAVADSTFDIGTQIQGIKLTVVVSLGVLALEILWAWMFPPTAAAVEEAAVSTTRSFLKVAEDIVQRNITKLAAAMGARTDKRLFWREIATGTIVAPSAKGWGVYGARAIENAALSLGIDGAVQGGQMLDGKRRHFNGAQFGLSGLSAVAGVIPGRELARFMGIGSHKILGNQLNNTGGRIVRGAVIGGSAGVTSAAFGNLAVGAVTGDWSAFSSGAGWTGGAARGALAGGARGGFAKSSSISSSDIRYRVWMHKSGAPRGGDHPAGSTGNRGGPDGSQSSQRTPTTGREPENTSSAQRTSNPPPTQSGPAQTQSGPAQTQSSSPPTQSNPTRPQSSPAHPQSSQANTQSSQANTQSSHASTQSSQAQTQSNPPSTQSAPASAQNGGENRGRLPGTSWFDEGSSVSSHRAGGDAPVVAAPGAQNRGGQEGSSWFDEGSSVSSRPDGEGRLVPGSSAPDRGGSTWFDDGSSVSSRHGGDSPVVSGAGAQNRGGETTWFDDGSSMAGHRPEDGVVVTGDHPGWRPPTSFESSVDGNLSPSRTPPTSMLTNRPPGSIHTDPSVPQPVSPGPTQSPPMASGALPASSGGVSTNTGVSTNATAGSGNPQSSVSGPSAGPPAQTGGSSGSGNGNHHDEEKPFLGAGKDLRAKSRPRIYPHDGEPLPGEFHAADAPQWGEWLPPGAYPASAGGSNPDDGPNVAEGGSDPDDRGARTEGAVDIPFTLGNR